MPNPYDAIQTGYVRILAKALSEAHEQLRSTYGAYWNAQINGNGVDGWQCRFESQDINGHGIGESFHISPAPFAFQSEPQPPDASATALHIITVLRGRSYTVEISGDDTCYVKIQTITADMEWEADALTTEEAVILAARELYDHSVETTEALGLYIKSADGQS